MKILHIYEEEETSLAETTEKVLMRLREGFTSGFDPDWDIEEVKDES